MKSTRFIVWASSVLAASLLLNGLLFFFLVPLLDPTFEDLLGGFFLLPWMLSEPVPVLGAYAVVAIFVSAYAVGFVFHGRPWGRAIVTSLLFIHGFVVLPLLCLPFLLAGKRKELRT